MESQQSNARAIIEEVKRLHEPHDLGKLESDDADDATIGDLLVVPVGMQVVDTKPYRDARLDRPERRAGTAKLTTLDSFIAHVLRSSDTDSAIFADDTPTAPKLLAVYDYHEANARAEDGAVVEGEARFGKHRAQYAFPVDEAWAAWTKLSASREGLDQAELARWLEDRIGDVLAPDSVGTTTREIAEKFGIELAGPSTLLTLARGIAIRANTSVRQAVSLQTGETQISYEETHEKTGGAQTVPGGFAIGIPVFRAGAPYQIAARLRYRIANGSIRWFIQLHRTEVTFEHAFTEACAHVAKETSLPLFYGAPEA